MSIHQSLDSEPAQHRAGAQTSLQKESSCEGQSAENAKHLNDGATACPSVASGHEWEQDTSDQSCESAMSQLFENGQQPEEVHEHISLPGMPTLSVRSVSRSQRHTLKHTGGSCTSAPSMHHVRMFTLPLLKVTFQVSSIAGHSGEYHFMDIRFCVILQDSCYGSLHLPWLATFWTSLPCSQVRLQHSWQSFTTATLIVLLVQLSSMLKQRWILCIAFDMHCQDILIYR